MDGLMSPPKLLNAQEAGDQLGVSASWVLRQARLNEIPHVRLGKFVRFDAEHLDEWWRRHEQGPLHMLSDRKAA